MDFQIPLICAIIPLSIGVLQNKGDIVLYTKVVKADPARKADYIAIMEDSMLYERYWADDPEALDTWITDALAAGGLLIAESSSGEAVGLCDCRWNGMFAVYPYLALLGVKKKFRGMGVGSTLIKTFEEISKAMGAEKAFICGDCFNPRARMLYQRLGYKKYCILPSLFKKGNDEVMMMKIFIYLNLKLNI